MLPRGDSRPTIRYRQFTVVFTTRKPAGAKTLAIGSYPAVSLARARNRRDEARELLAQGIAPSTAKREAKQAKADAAAHTFELVARDWLAKTVPTRMDSTHAKVTTWLEKDVFPIIGTLPLSTIGPRDVLGALRKMEARGALDSAQRAPRLIKQVQSGIETRPQIGRAENRMCAECARCGAHADETLRFTKRRRPLARRAG